MQKILRAVSAIPILLVLGCASNNQADPLETFNRNMYSLNDAGDRLLVRPAAEVYDFMLPKPVKTGVGNFFTNLSEPWSMVNHLLQGEGGKAAETFLRFMVNSTIGVAGLIDVSTPAGLKRKRSGFGDTLGAWGVGHGPYLVLPLFGPGTVRSSTGAIMFDRPASLWPSIGGKHTAAGSLVRLIDKRAQLLEASNFLSAVSLDPYVFVRSAYLQSQGIAVDDVDGDEDFYDEEELDE